MIPHVDRHIFCIAFSPNGCRICRTTSEREGVPLDRSHTYGSASGSGRYCILGAGNVVHTAHVARGLRYLPYRAMRKQALSCMCDSVKDGNSPRELILARHRPQTHQDEAGFQQGIWQYDKRRKPRSVRLARSLSQPHRCLRARYCPICTFANGFVI